jgi:hypothetical protein
MSSRLAGLMVGLVLGSVAAQGAERQGPGEIPVQTTARAPFELPASYGRLAGVAVNSGVHYLYFEGQDGSIRILLVGPRGSIQQARAELQVLSPDVYLMERSHTTQPATE